MCAGELLTRLTVVSILQIDHYSVYPNKYHATCQLYLNLKKSLTGLQHVNCTVLDPKNIGFKEIP